ncbi:MAG: hypothetical protein LW878_14165 [Proteobacteria bacterium]|jgi:hypothetical protein|nr:hypothetical protein [Pseudomonadota bacterium]
MLRLIALSMLLLSCSKNEKDNKAVHVAPKEPSVQVATAPQPSTETKTKPSEELAKTPVPKPQEAEPEVKVEVKEVAKPLPKPRQEQTITLAAGQFKTMEFAGNTKPTVNGGTSQVYKLSEISRLKLLGLRFELNLSKVPLDHIVSFSYAGRFDIHLTTDIGVRKICGEGFAETPVQLKGRKPGRPVEISFPRVQLSSFIGEDDCSTSVSKTGLSTPVSYSIAPVDGKTQMEIFIHEPIQITITDHLNEIVAPGTYPVGFNVIVQTEISN